MKFLKTYIFFFLVFSYTLISAQTTGDFRSRQNGNWNDPNSWEYYNGTIWVNPATTYPGQIATTANDVVIRNSHSISLGVDLSTSGTINSVTIGDRNGSGLASIETLTITNTAGLNTTSFTIAYDGFVTWQASVNKSLKFPANTNIVVEPVHPDEGVGGVALHDTHGLHANTTPCSNSRALEIGTSKYSSCQGAGSLLTFDQVNNAGGNLNVSPSFTAPACINQTLNLFANPGGSELDDTPINYSWNVIPPSGANYAITATENPTDTPLLLGSYIYEVTITNNSGITNTNSVTIEVTSCNKKVITNRRITYRVKK
ncbi:hypothetical protein H3Z83_02040 [Tenacibaculum sp. S7007]|uniref:PKD domain-containing protein n=1 Tax=Tenacibaculum pelagium TaxID=2759527 RepID=A0A839AMA8_9FLAO|nr:hypothetical protein [Tenacibaculum pelagium]MBA6155309.1 hypothetical protein [Tenacibaculum pelagium]